MHRWSDGWVMKNWCFWTVVLEKTLESPLDCKEIKLVSLKGNQSWVFIGRADAEAEAPFRWPKPPDVQNWLIGKDSDAGKDWNQKEKRVTENEIIGWHHQLNGHECKQIPGDSGGRGAWRAVVHGVAKSQTWLSNWTELNLKKTHVLKSQNSDLRKG